MKMGTIGYPLKRFTHFLYQITRIIMLSFRLDIGMIYQDDNFNGL